MATKTTTSQTGADYKARIDILRAIDDGKHDDWLDEIANACIQRRRRAAIERTGHLSPGDRIRFNQTVKPAYMRGLTGTIVGFPARGEKLLVRLDRSAGRFSSEATIRVPRSIVEPIPTATEED